MNHDLAALKQLKENSTTYLMLGIGLVLFGILALAYSYFTTLISVVYIGCTIVGLGVFEGVKSFKSSKWTSFFLHIFLSVLYIIGGIFIIINPTLNAVTLTLLLAIFFVISGISRIIFAVTQKVPHKNFILFNGVMTLLLGILIWMRWPYSGLWVLGMFIGIDMIVTGFTWIQLSLMAKNIQIKNL